MPVYVLAIGPAPYEDGRPVKLGWSSNLASRLRSIQTSHPEPLSVVRLIEGHRSIERWMQQQFRAQHIQGEWFALCAEMLTIQPPARHFEASSSPVRRADLVSWAADMCTRQNPCQQCRETPPWWTPAPHTNSCASSA